MIRRAVLALILLSGLAASACPASMPGPDDEDAAMDAATNPDVSTTLDAAVSGDATVAQDGAVDVPAMPNAAGQIVITEIMAAPAGYVDDALAEWVEIHNPSASTTYDLAGCVFADKPADDDFTITGSVLIGPGEYLVLSSNTATIATHGFVSDVVYGSTGTGLSGTSDAPTIKCASMVIDTVSYAAATGFPFPDAADGHTLQLSSDVTSSTGNDVGANWCHSSPQFYAENFGTPGAANGSCAPVMPSAAGQLVITEIMAAPAGYADDALAEWVEIHNPSLTATYDLAGCVFSDKPADDDFTIQSQLLIGPGDFLVLSSNTFTVATHGFVSDVVYGTTGTGLSGTSDAPTIKCASVVIDTVAYNEAASFPLPDSADGRALSLTSSVTSATGNDIGTNWCHAVPLFFADNYGTPRAANEACAPVGP